MLKYPKYLIIGIVFTCSMLFASVQPEIKITEMKKTVPCAATKDIITDLANGDYKELPFWMGKDTDSKYVLMANPKTLTWTFIQYDETTACVLGSGSNHTQIFNGPKV